MTGRAGRDKNAYTQKSNYFGGSSGSRSVREKKEGEEWQDAFIPWQQMDR